jgi:7-keto-8-aminopelargonate synthetase-like enzyme
MFGTQNTKYIPKVGHKEIKHIRITNTHNMLHKRHKHNLNQIRNILQQSNLTVAKADKSKTIVFINKNTLNQKANNFIQENHIAITIKIPQIPTKSKYNKLLKNATH